MRAPLPSGCRYFLTREGLAAMKAAHDELPRVDFGMAA